MSKSMAYTVELECPELDDSRTLQSKCLASDLPIMDKSERGKDRCSALITIINSSAYLEVNMLLA